MNIRFNLVLMALFTLVVAANAISIEWIQTNPAVGGLMVLNNDGNIVSANGVSANGYTYFRSSCYDLSHDSTIWIKTYGADSLRILCSAFTYTSDDHYAVVSSWYREFWFGTKWGIVTMYFDSNGDTLWSAWIKGEDYRELDPLDITETSDGGFLLLCETVADTSPGMWRVPLLIKLSNDGEFEWQKDYGQPLRYLHPYRLARTADDEYLVCGSSAYIYDNPWAYGDGFLLKVNEDGDEISWQFYADSLLMHAFVGVSIYSMTITENGDMIFCGSRDRSERIGPKWWTVRANPHGDLLWYHKYDEDDSSSSLWYAFELSDGNLMFFGEGYDDSLQAFEMVILETNGDGDLIERYDVNPARSLRFSVAQPRILALGKDEFLFRSRREEIAKVTTRENQVVGGGAVADAFTLLPAFPNPFNSSVRISFAVPHPAPVKVALYDLTGREVALLINEPQTAGFHTVTWPATNAPTGLYFVRMSAPDFSRTQRVVLIK